jgi:hypothetical protein
MAQLYQFNLGVTGKTGTVGFQFFDVTKASLGARTTVGVTEVSTFGIYEVSTTPPAGAVSIVWNDADTGGAGSDDSISRLSATDVWAEATRTLTAGTNIVLPSNGLSSVTAWTVALSGTGLATSAQAVKLLAATYDSASLSGSTLTLSNAATMVVSSTGRVTTG